MPKYHLNNDYITEPIPFSDIFLLQIGRLYFSPGDVMPLHVHKDFYELTIITDGEGEVITNGVRTPVKRGDIYVSLPCDMHEIVSSVNSPMKYDFFSFSTVNEAYRAELEEITKLISPSERVFEEERIKSLVCDVIMEFIEAEEFSTEPIYSILNQIIIYLLRAIKHGTKPRMRNASEPEAICYRIMNYIDTHIYTLENLESLSEAMNYNYSYLSSLFAKNTGNTLLSYYQKKRLEVARQLIAEGKLNMTEIAATLNYSSLYSFSRAFKEMYGLPPKQYAKINSQ